MDCCNGKRWPFCCSNDHGDGADGTSMFGPLHDFTIVEYPELYPNYARPLSIPGAGKKKTPGQSGIVADSLLVPAGAVRPVLKPKRRSGQQQSKQKTTAGGGGGVRWWFDSDPAGGQEVRAVDEEGTARVWEELENYIVAGAEGMPQPILTMDEQLAAQKRVVRLDRLLRKLSRKHKKEAKKRHCQKLCHLLHIMHEVVKNEYDAQKEAIVTRSEYFAQRRYSKKIPEHWDSDDDTMEHAITHVRISHPEWAETDKEGLKLRREDRLIRRMAPEQFWVWYRGRTFRTLLFCFILYGFAALFVYIVEREFGKLEEQVRQAKGRGFNFTAKKRP